MAPLFSPRSLTSLITIVVVLSWRAALAATGSPWVLVGPPVGGYASSMAVDAVDTSLVYAVVYAPAAKAWGLFRSVDGGATWTAVTAVLPDGTQASSSATVVVADLSIGSTVYLGTTNGVFKSVDRGGTWTRTGFPASNRGDVPGRIPLGPEDKVGVSTLAMYSVGSGVVLYAGTSLGLYRSADRGDTVQALVNGLPGFSISTVLADPAGSDIYVGYGCIWRGCGVYKSQDGGASFAQVFAWPGLMIGKIANPATAVYSIVRAPNGVLYAATDRGVVQSADAAASWTHVGLNSAAWSLAADPSDARVIYAVFAGSGVFKSADGGVSFTKLGLDVDSIVIVRVSASTLLTGTRFGGVYRSADGGASWMGSLSGLPPLLPTGVAAGPTNASPVFAATPLGGLFRSTDRAATWERTSLPYTMCSVTIDPSVPSTVYAVSNSNGIYKSTDTGQSWQQIRNPIPMAGSPACELPELLPVARVIVNPRDSQMLYATTLGGTVTSSDGGATWTEVTSLGCCDLVLAMAFDPKSASTRWVVPTGSSAPRVSTDSGQTFAPTASPGNCCRPFSIVVTGAGTLLVGLKDTNDVYRSTDRGQTWTRVLSRSNSSDHGTMLALDPEGTAVYAAAPPSAPYGSSKTLDVFRSLDDGVTWSAYGTGIPASAAAARDLSIGPGGSVYLATAEGLYVNPGDGPFIASVSPATGSVLGGTRVTISGSNFTSGATVKFGGAAAAAVSVVSPTSVLASTPASSIASIVDVTVTNPDGRSATSTGAFTYSCVYSAPMRRVQTVTASGLPPTNVSIVGTVATLPGFAFCGGVLPTSDVPWIQITPPATGGPRGVQYPSFIYTVSANTSAAPRTGHITVDRIVYDVLQAGVASTPPFGLIDTPAVGQTALYGSVAVTGWVLDDIEVTEVQIWRDPHSSDPPGAIFQGGAAPQTGKIFIGYATMVAGARPDVEALYPTYPFANRAGWGYLMLTRGLVWDGQGPFKLYAYAVDRESHIVSLGNTTIAIDNSTSRKPFGAIDTPDQGATVSGQAPNTGWVLTPNSGASIPAANVRVAVDGVFLSDVPSMSDRSDITSGFTQFTTTGAGRGIFIDTTRYSDGMHTLAWQVTDTAGNSDGIGSRFFNVGNVGGSSLGAGSTAGLDVAAVGSAPLDRGTIAAVHGWDSAAPLQRITAHEDDVVRLAGEQLERYEIHLGDPAGGSWVGGMRAGDAVRGLPVGSHLDPSTGVFTWQATAAFIGQYDLVFFRMHAGAVVARREISILVAPQTKRSPE